MIHDQVSSSLELTPSVLEKLEVIQNRPSVANTALHPTPSKSAENKTTKSVYPEKSISLTLAERRKNSSSSSITNNNNTIPASFKLTSCSNMVTHPQIADDEYIIKSLEDLLQKVTITDSVTPGLEETAEPFWENFIRNATTKQARLDLLYRVATAAGIPDNLRCPVWQSICQTSTDLTILYSQLLNQTTNDQNTVTIQDDVQRLFSPELQESATRILQAYSVHDTYQKGMAHLLLPILICMPEVEAFTVLVRLIQLNDMLTNGPRIFMQQYQALLTRCYPQLDAHFARFSVHTDMYAAQWYNTLCTNLLVSESHMMRLYDLVLLEGAVETVIRVAWVLLQKNQDHLLSLTTKDELLSFLNGPPMYMQAYGDNIDTFILDIAMCRPSFAQVQQQATITTTESKHISTQTAPIAQQQQQMESLAAAMAGLKKKYAALCEENKTLRMNEMDQEAAQAKLAKRNAVLEKRVKKYKVKLADASSAAAQALTEGDENTSTTTTAAADADADSAAATASVATTVKKEKRQDQYSSFVASLRDTGDFGALIAGALAPTIESKEAQAHLLGGKQEDSEEEEGGGGGGATSNQQRLDAALQNVTSELVAVKLDHFETSQRYESLYRHCQELTGQLQSMQESQTTLVQKIIYLESELEDVQTERDQIYADQEEVLSMTMVAKKTAAELQLEKMALVKEVEKLEHQVKELRDEKEAYFMPRDTFSEEVFAAHSILFGQQQQQQQQQKKDLTRRHTLQLGKNAMDEEYKNKFVESELRCRELEKYLAETKVKLAEYESSVGITTSSCSIISPRGSLQQHRRASSTFITNNKRNSTASLSMLANRVSTPTSPRERRESTESYASSTTSMTSMSSINCNSKRSSVYSRIWNAFGSPTTPIHPVAVNMMKNDIMCEEPRIIEQQ